MALKEWPGVRDLRFALKCGRYLRGALRRHSGVNWQEFRRIARYFQTDDMGSLAERGLLFRLAAALPPGARVVEVGSWLGASTCFLAGGLTGPDARILAVDNFAGRSTCAEDEAWYERHFRRLGRRSTLELFRTNVASLGFTSRVEPLVSDSLAAAGYWADRGEPLDLLFIDADHSEAACRADIAAWAPLVRPGGIVAFHDFGSRAEGVTRAIFEAIKDGCFAEIVGVAGTVIAFRR